MNNNILIILGTGRSGTSFISSWLDACGLTMGMDLIDPDWRNKKGFYEDKEIVQLHKKIYNRYEKKKFSDFFLNEVIIEKNVTIEKRTFSDAVNILKVRNRLYRQWGFKDPKTILVMKDLWHKLIPNAKILLIYRDFREVIDSLSRLERNINRPNKFKAIKKNAEYLLGIQDHKKNNARLEGWVYQNSLILKFLKENKNRNDYLIIDTNTLISNPDLVFSKLTVKMSFNLNYVAPSTIFKKDMLGIAKNDKHHFDKPTYTYAERLLIQLKQMSALTLNHY